MLQLTRPIAFIDLETTGVNLSTDRIVEIAIVKLLTDGSRQVKRKLINPQIPIPAATTENSHSRSYYRNTWHHQ